MGRLLRQYWWLFPLFTAIGLLFFSYHYLDDLARHLSGTIVARFIEEMSGAYTAMVLMPLIIWFTRRFAWPWQFVGVIVYSLVHTTLMAVTRDAIFPLAGLGSYDYGIMSFRYPMEASHDLIIYPIVVGFIYFYDRVRRAREAELAAANLERELAKARLENLRLQLQPHFLFNTLNAVSSVMYEDVGKADAMLARLSEFLRVVLTTSEAQEITLDEELEIERMYLDVMKARLENALELRIVADPDTRMARVPPLILQPVLENCVRHGMPGACADFEVRISAVRSGDMLEMRISDNGSGPGDDAPKFGHGLTNVRSRLTQLHGERSAVQVAQLAPQGTEVCLLLPLRV
jgi:two-component system, LytTR family, sensor kinase